MCNKQDRPLTEYFKAIATQIIISFWIYQLEPIKRLQPHNAYAKILDWDQVTWKVVKHSHYSRHHLRHP